MPPERGLQLPTGGTPGVPRPKRQVLAEQWTDDPVHRGIERAMQGRWFGPGREARGWLGVAAPDVDRKGGGQYGMRRGLYDRGGRVMLAEEGALTSCAHPRLY